MNNLLNDTELTLNIKNHNLENAINLYKKKITIFLSLSNSPKELQKLLYSMNTFIYTYFCITISLDLEDLCYKNINVIETCNSKEELITLGEEIIKSYIDVVNDGNPVSKNEIIKQVLAYIHSNIEKKITLEKAATHIHISSNYLCYLFKETTGVKFCEYINLCRINVAKDHLNNSSNSLDIISFKAGFNSQSHFCTTFKKYEGVSPNEYRKRIQKKN